MSKRMDELADHLFYAIGERGAGSYQELADRMTKRTGEEVAKHQVNTLMVYVRDHAERLGWMVPPAKRGKHEAGRFMRMLIPAAGEKAAPVFDRYTDREKLHQGALGTVRHTSSSNRHQAHALAVAAMQTKDPRYREMIESVAEDCDALSKKSARIARILKFSGGAA